MAEQFAKLTGLWANKDAAGNITSISGTVGSAKFLILPNRNKTAANHPDFELFVVPAEARDGTRGGDARGQRQAPAASNGTPPAAAGGTLPAGKAGAHGDISDDDIPF